MKYTIALIAAALSFSVAQAQSDPVKYDLFNPVPKSKMREMGTDRPDVTENAYTLDAGHFQVETDLLKTTRSKENGTTYIENFYNLANMKLGITDNTDLQLVLNSYQQNRSVPGNSFTGTYFNDIALRLKHNLFGNNSDKTALSIMPFVNIPFNGDKRLDGGVIFPFAAGLKNGWALGAQAEFDLAKNDGFNGYHGEILNSITLNRSIFKAMEGFVESFYNYSMGDKSFRAYADAGLIYSVSDNLKLDAGLNYGLTKDAGNVYFVGLSFRY